MRLSSNHLSRSFEDFAKAAIKFSTVSETACHLHNLQFLYYCKKNLLEICETNENPKLSPMVRETVFPAINYE